MTSLLNKSVFFTKIINDTKPIFFLIGYLYVVVDRQVLFEENRTKKRKRQKRPLFFSSKLIEK